MRQFTKKVVKILYRDGPMLVASSLFVSLFIQNIGGIAS